MDIKEIFSGKMVERERFLQMLEEQKRSGCFTSSWNLRKIWREFSSVENPVINEYTRTLVLHMLKGLDHDVMHYWGNWIFSTETLGKLSKCFPDLVDRFLLRRILDGTLPASSSLLVFYKERFKKEDYKKIKPACLDTLVMMIKFLGVEEIVEKLQSVRIGYLRSSDRFVLYRIFDCFPAEYYERVLDILKRKGLEKSFVVALMVGSKNIPDGLRQRYISYLSRLKEPPSVTFGREFQIPERISEESLCKLIIFLSRCVENPQMVKGVPSLKQMKFRIFGVKLKGNDVLYRDALEARARLKEGKDYMSIISNAVSNIKTHFRRPEKAIIERARRINDKTVWRYVPDVMYIVLNGIDFVHDYLLYVSVRGEKLSLSKMRVLVDVLKRLDLLSEART